MWDLIWPELRRYLWIEGRSSRREWWQVEGAVIFSYWFFGAGATLLAVLHGEPSLLPGPIRLALGALTFWVNIVSTVRRLHDRDKSGWHALFYFFPGVGILWHFIECGLLPGSKGRNRYGPPPVDDARAPLERIAAILKQGAFQPPAPPPATRRSGIPDAVPRQSPRPAARASAETAMRSPAMPAAAHRGAQRAATRAAHPARAIGANAPSAITRPRSHGTLVLAIVAFIAIVVFASTMVTVRVTEVGPSPDLPVFAE